MIVYVLLYNSGTSNEGIHTLQIGDRDCVLMFESEDDAVRYGLLLEAQDFPLPSAEGIEIEEIEDFCASAGYDYKFISDGMLEVPPLRIMLSIWTGILMVLLKHPLRKILRKRKCLLLN